MADGIMAREHRRGREHVTVQQDKTPEKHRAGVNLLMTTCFLGATLIPSKRSVPNPLAAGPTCWENPHISTPLHWRLSCCQWKKDSALQTTKGHMLEHRNYDPGTQPRIDARHREGRNFKGSRRKEVWSMSLGFSFLMHLIVCLGFFWLVRACRT